MDSEIFEELEEVDKSKDKHIQENLKLLNLKVQELRLEKVWQQFTEDGFHPILIKGWATALNYPNPADRLYVDVDLVFDDEEFVRAQDYINQKTLVLAIDLHKGARHLDSLTFAELYQNSVLKPCGNTQIRVPSDEDHLRILCVHWLNDGGAYKDKLWDIYHAVNNRREDFDWDKCLNVVVEKRRKWIICAIALAHKYLELPVENLPFKKEINNIPKWVIKTVEKEWATDVRLMPLHYYLRDKKQLWKQIKKRIPPNPIQATIEVGGAFDNTPRIFYQLADIFKRLLPSWKRISESLWKVKK